MSGGGRFQHHKEDEEIAYRLQVMGAREGAIKGTLVAGTIIAFCNWRFPWMRRQTLAGKGFLCITGTIFGMVTHADHYLLEWEKEHRAAAEVWRTQARNELAAKGTVPSETHMRSWKRAFDAEKLAKERALPVEAQPAATSPSGVLDKLKESAEERKKE